MGMIRRMLGSERDRIAAAVEKELRRLGAVDTHHDREHDLVLYRVPGQHVDDPSWLTLGALVGHVTRARPEQRTAVIQGYLATMLSDDEPLPLAWHEAAPKIRLILKDRTFVHEQFHGGPELEVLHRPALEALVQIPVMDGEYTVRMLGPEVLDRWRVTEDELFDTGLHNLEALALADGPPGASSYPSSVSYVDDGSHYYASRLLLPGWVAAHAERVSGPPVVFVPDQSTVIVTTAASRGFSDQHLKMLGRYLRSPRPLSPLGYGLDATGRVGLVRLDPQTEVGRRTVAAERLLTYRQYRRQAEVLRKRIALGGHDIHVCAVRIPPDPDRWDEVAVRLWTEWPPRECLLPVVDDVVLVADGVRFTVAWADLVAELPLVPEPDLDPPRIRVPGWPDRAVMDRLWARRRADPPA